MQMMYNLDSWMGLRGNKSDRDRQTPYGFTYIVESRKTQQQ